MSRELSRLMLLGIAIVLAGCASWDSALDAMRPPGYHVTAEEKDDDWEWVGEEGRAGRPMEHDPDPWFKYFVQSDRARSIERNLGID